MALTSNALTDLATLKDFLNIKDTRMDTALEGYIESGSDAIRSYLGFDPVSTDYTDEKYSGQGLDFLRLKHRPITAVTTVKIDDTEQDITDIEFSNATIYLAGAFPSGVFNIKVSYTAGYSTIPFLIQETALRLAALMFKERDGRIGINSTSDQGGSVTRYEVQFTKYLEELFSYKVVEL